MDPVDFWDTTYQQDFPTLHEIAVRLLPVAIQSADVERCCKVNKLIHTKIRNRLLNKHVRMLMTCYVNLRLLKSIEEEENSKSTGEAIYDNNGELEGLFLDKLLDVDDFDDNEELEKG